LSAKHFLLLAAAASLPLLSSCGSKAPTGQVVATVNGQEVTAGELNQEAQTQGVPNANDPNVRQQLLQRVIERKLLASSATEAKVDRDPQYLLARKRAEELMLAEAFIRKVLVKNGPPTAAELDGFVRSHPDMFDQRTIFSVDQITFRPVEDKALMQRLIAAKTLDELDGLLAGAGVPRERTNTNWDSAEMRPDAVRRLKSLPPGEPFLQPSNPSVAGVITGMRASPLPEQARRAIAGQALQRQQVEQAVTSWLQGMKRSAKIQYQPGFAPKAPEAAPQGPGATPAASGGQRKI
jgi:EpsD family peptidyl-prolyl cis-trans isomerase